MSVLKEWNVKGLCGAGIYVHRAALDVEKWVLSQGTQSRNGS